MPSSKKWLRFITFNLERSLDRYCILFYDNKHKTVKMNDFYDNYNIRQSQKGTKQKSIKSNFFLFLFYFTTDECINPNLKTPLASLYHFNCILRRKIPVIPDNVRFSLTSVGREKEKNKRAGIKSHYFLIPFYFPGQ